MTAKSQTLYEFNKQALDQRKRELELNYKLLGATAAGGAALLASTPAVAQTTPEADITAAINSLSGIAGAALAVVLGVFVTAMGVKYAKRVTSKG